ncbi:MAG: RNA polymerase sigma factor [Verrucomicrobia bacterium]|nr:RNA polymerase sigma factor [Verrucomicrobiota bacterium]
MEAMGIIEFRNWFGLGDMADEDVMVRVRDLDDSNSFALLENRWRAPITRLCERMLGGDVHAGQDLTQETFVRLYSRRSSYQPRAKFSTYLWRIALNLCHDELRRRSRRGEPRLSAGCDDECLSAHEAEVHAPGPDSTLIAHEHAEVVRDVLRSLSPAHREVLVFRHFEGLKFREIAELLQIPEGTVKSRMVEALDQAARCFEKRRRLPARPGSGAAEDLNL